MSPETTATTATTETTGSAGTPGIPVSTTAAPRRGWRAALTHPVVPLTLVLLYTAYSLHRSSVGYGDIVAFTAYVALGLALPGVVLWRLLVSRGRWSFLADLACGMSLAYATELAVYLVCAHLDQPGIAHWWPVVPLAVSLLPRCRPLVWRRTPEVTPRWMVWLLNGLGVLAVTVLTRTYWSGYPLDGRAGRSPYVDIPYHLSLIGALKRHVPVDVPAVAGEPLYYHWFVHADLAAASHATGIEPLILLTRLGPLPMVLVVVLGVAAIVHHHTRAWTAAAVAAALLCCSGGVAISRPLGNLFLSKLVFLSPTTVFATAIFTGVIAITLELLRESRTDRPARTGWLVLVLTLGAASGAKGSLLPVILAGYAAMVAMGLLVNRRLNRAALAMTVSCAVWFELAQHLIYGGSSQGTAIKPFGMGQRIAEAMDPLGAQVGVGAAALVTLVYIVSRMLPGSGMVGLFTRDAWREPGPQFVVACSLAAGAAVVIFDNAAFNQVYFLLVAPPAIAIASAWGFATMARRLPAPAVRRICLSAAAVGLCVGWLAKRLYADGAVHQHSYVDLVLPTVVVFVICALAALPIARFAGPGHRRLAVLLGASTAFAALAVPPTLVQVADIATSPSAQFARGSALVPPIIGRGGVEAARWLRDHSDPDAVVATNAHCLFATRPRCDHRTTWIAGFTERQMLVEGWAYTSRSAEVAAKQGVPVAYADFWDPARLTANDDAIQEPTAERVNHLRDEYGVSWIFVDPRFPADTKALKQYADLRFRTHGGYAVFELR